MSKKQKFNIYRDGKIHICKRMCKTCIYRPGSPLMGVPIKAEAQKADTAVVCHSTLGTKENAVCRGFFDATPTVPLMMARAMGVIEWH